LLALNRLNSDTTDWETLFVVVNIAYPNQNRAAQHSETKLYYYANQTARTLTLRLDSPGNERFECVLFPYERRFFTAAARSILHVYRHERNGLELIEAIACQHLHVLEVNER